MADPIDPRDEPKLLDAAIAACEQNILAHRRQARWTVVTLFASMLLLAGTLLSGLFAGVSGITGYILLALTVLVFGMLMSLYRFHLNEIAKAEHWKVGFWRIRIAANNLSPGFQSEVRVSLTHNAFEHSARPLRKSREVDSPLPGHPTSDLASSLVNKILEQLDVRLLPKGDTVNGEKR